jgi:hypothetical protein
MRKQFLDLAGWHFDMDEISAGVYEVVGEDEGGHRVSATGTDLDALLDQCKNAALRVAATLSGKA